MNEVDDVWFKLLTLFDKANHLVKERDSIEKDNSSFYELKDHFLDLIVKKNPEELRIKFFNVPYFKYSDTTKDKAGDLMRSDNKKKPFEYYLSKVEASEYDIEIQEKATIELEIICKNRLFSFHIPQKKTLSWGLDYNSMEKKTWISGKEFHKNQMNSIKKEINELMDKLNFTP